jgi:hypothetical protein
MDKPRPAQPRFEFAVLGDNPIDPKGAEGDILGFVELVRPFAARIGRSRENTPFTVGIYADWGQGKSSVMRLLQAELEGLDPPAICVWFYPWKYHTREEVWRGLILTLIHQVQASDTLARQLARRRGALSRLAAKWLWRTFTRVTGGIVPEKWADELVETVSKEPWSPAHLHRFEEQLDLLFRQLAPGPGKAGGAGAQLPLLVLMVDDLDRCLPEPAAAVLEALKLVLNRKGMVTVLGIAEGEVYRAIQALYARTLMAGEEGLRADWGRDYLRKIVQIPFHLPRVSEGAFEDYVGRCLERSAVAGALPRSADWRPVLRRACQENLREVKRFLNRFVAEWDKAEANAPRNQAVIGAKALDPARVAFVLAADNLADGFLDRITAVPAPASCCAAIRTGSWRRRRQRPSADRRRGRRDAISRIRAWSACSTTAWGSARGDPW